MLTGGCGAPAAPRAVETAPALVEAAVDANPDATNTNAKAASSAANATSDGSAATQAPPGPEPLPATGALANDTSLTLTVYQAAGVPEIERAWSVLDYERCLSVLFELLRSGRQDLPRLGSARSGALFARLVDARNFAAQGVTSRERAPELQRYLDVFPRLLKLYSPANDHIDFSAEQAELTVCLLELLGLALAESRAFALEDPAWNEEYEQQISIAAGVVRGVVAMFAERERYSSESRGRLRRDLARLAPALAPHLGSDDARRLREAAID